MNLALGPWKRTNCPNPRGRFAFSKFGANCQVPCVLTPDVALSFLCIQLRNKVTHTYSPLLLIQSNPWLIGRSYYAFPQTFGVHRFPMLSTELACPTYQWRGMPSPLSTFIALPFLSPHVLFPLITPHPRKFPISIACFLFDFTLELNGSWVIVTIIVVRVFLLLLLLADLHRESFTEVILRKCVPLDYRSSSCLWHRNSWVDDPINMKSNFGPFHVLWYSFIVCSSWMLVQIFNWFHQRAWRNALCWVCEDEEGITGK